MELFDSDDDSLPGNDVSGHQHDYRYLARLLLVSLAHKVGAEPNAVCARYCSEQWFLWDGIAYRKLSHSSMASRCRPILDAAWFRVSSKDGVEKRQRLDPTSHTVNESLVAMQALPGVGSEVEPDQGRDDIVPLNGRIEMNAAEHKVTEHTPDVFATRRAPLEYPLESSPELEAARVRWATYLESIGLGDETLAYLHRAFGYALTGRGCEKAFFFLHGEPHTGKSTLVRLVMNVLGKTSDGGYAAETACNDWLATSGPQSSGHTDSLMAIEGARLVFGDETGEGARFNERLIKQAIGGAGSTLRLSAKGEKGRGVPCRFGLFFASNHLPRTQDPGVVSRLKLIQFTRVIENKDPNFEENFMTPIMRQAVLMWLVEGCRSYLKNGLGAEPPSVVMQRAAFLEEQDWFKTALLELVGRPRNLWQGNAEALKASSLSGAIARWLRDSGQKQVPPPQNQLAARLRVYLPTLEAYRKGGSLYFRGLALRHDKEGYPVAELDDLEL